MKILALALTLSVLCASAAGADSVEVALDGFAPGYGEFKPSAGKVTPNYLGSDGGVKYLRLQTGGQSAQQWVPVTPRTKSIRFKMKVRRGDQTGRRFEVILTAADADKKFLSNMGGPSGLGVLKESVDHLVKDVKSTTWDKIELSGEFPPNAAFLVVSLYSLEKGTLDFAEIEITTRASPHR